MSNITDFIFNSTYPLDKVLGIFTGSFTAASGSSTPVLATSFDTGIDDLSFFDGTMQIDNSSTTQQIGISAWFPNSAKTAVYLVDVGIGSEVGKINVFYRNTDSVNHTVNFSICILDKPSNTTYNLNNPNAPNNKFYFNSNNKFLFIEETNTQTVSLPAGTTANPVNTTVTFNNSLSYPACSRVYIDNGTYLIDGLVPNSFVNVYQYYYGSTSYSIYITPTVSTGSTQIILSNNTEAVNLNVTCRTYYLGTSLT